MTWNDVLIDVVNVAARVIIVIAIPYVFNLLRQYIHNQKVERVISYAEGIIADSVRMTNQTFVDSLKKEGKFDKDAQEEAFAACRMNILQMLNDNTMKLIEEQVGDVSAWIDTKVESEVSWMK